MMVERESEAIKVVYGIDRNYLVQATVSIHSLCERATAPLEIVVYGDGLEPSDHETLLKMGKASGADPARTSMSAGMPPLQGLRRRWLAIDMEGRPLGAYIDPGIDSQGNLATARRRLIRTTVLDLLLPKRSRRRRQVQLSRAVRMGLRPGDVYFNSGVLVMECGAIRSGRALRGRFRLLKLSKPSL